MIFMKMIKTYKELIKLQSFEERYNYLQLSGYVGEIIFGGQRYLNQILYSSSEWKKTRQKVIIRDEGCDLAHKDYQIAGKIYIHHINPITLDDIIDRCYSVFDINNLICVSFKTHNAIHYGTEESLSFNPVKRFPNDTCPWR